MAGGEISQTKNVNLLNIIPAVIGSLVAGQNQRAGNNAENQAIALQQDRYYNYEVPQLQLLQKIQQMLMDGYQSAADSGAYDFEKIQQNMMADQERTRSQAIKSTVAGLNLGGYRPGDSAATDSVDRANREINEDFQYKSMNLRQQLPLMEAQALGAVLNAGSGLANGSGNNLTNLLMNKSNTYNSRAGDPSGLLSSILPMLAGNSAAMGPSYGGGADFASGGGSPVTAANPTGSLGHLIYNGMNQWLPQDGGGISTGAYA